MSRQSRRRDERQANDANAGGESAFIPVADLALARERYYDLVKTRGLAQEDVHAILLGALGDALKTYCVEHYPDVPEPLRLLWSDFETLRRRNENDVEQFGGAVLVATYYLFATATIGKEPQRLPP